MAKVNDSGQSARLEMQAGADTQTLLRVLLARVTLHSFSAGQPSMEEIFLDRAGPGATATHLCC